MTTYLGNAFSLNMLPPGPQSLRVVPLTVREAGDLVQGCAIPVIGHVDTARLVADMLGLGPQSVPSDTDVIAAARQRPTVTLLRGDRLVVAQYRGPRLPEGATQLPEGATIEFSLVTVLP
jgi:hypothetical protein